MGYCPRSGPRDSPRFNVSYVPTTPLCVHSPWNVHKTTDIRIFDISKSQIFKYDLVLHRRGARLKWVQPASRITFLWYVSSCVFWTKYTKFTLESATSGKLRSYKDYRELFRCLSASPFSTRINFEVNACKKYRSLTAVENADDWWNWRMKRCSSGTKLSSVK